jgi:hypothetical protein
MALELIENDEEDISDVYADETLNMLEKRREEYIKGNIKGFTVDESMEFVKKELKKRGF